MAPGIQELRLAELRRRVQALPAEVNAWSERARAKHALEPHFSQINTLSRFMQALIDRQHQKLAALAPSSASFAMDALSLVSELNRVQRIWDFFRDKLSLRFSPDFSDGLWAADAIAWNCHREVLERAAAWGAVQLDQVREPPLTYLTADISPSTWARGTRPNDGNVYALGQLALPIAVIELPWDHLANVWELLSITHEVAHDLETDLGLEAALASALDTALEAAGIPDERRVFWRLWRREVFADLLALQLAGPAFLDALLQMLVLPDRYVYALDPGDEHPSPYLRILLDAAYLETLLPVEKAVAKDGARIAAAWKGLYGTPTPRLEAFLTDFPVVWEALVDQPLGPLKGRTARQLSPYLAADDVKIRAAAGFLATGQNKPGPMTLKPRHCVSAARLAIAEFPAGDALRTGMSSVQDRALELVRANTPPGVRAGNAPAKAFIEQLAERFFTEVAP